MVSFLKKSIERFTPDVDFKNKNLADIENARRAAVAHILIVVYEIFFIPLAIYEFFRSNISIASIVFSIAIFLVVLDFIFKKGTKVNILSII